jgi:SAM-dependent methyltransferase
MADFILLPATTYRPPSPQGRRQGKTLNPIIEDDGEDITITMSISHEPMSHGTKRNRSKSLEKIEQWLSPMSDHFPTPRGMHFLAAPIMPATPSAVSGYEADDTSSETSSSVPSVPSTQMWNNRASAMTTATEFDDLYDISDDEKSRKAQLRVNGISRNLGSKSSRSSRRVSQLPTDLRRSLTPLVIPAQRETDAGALSASLKKQLSPVPPTPPTHVSLEAAQLSFMRKQHALEVPTISAEPSLDGSLNSEELAAMSAPPTPLIGASDGAGDTWSGVQLQPGALATLQALSGGDDELEEPQEQVIEVLPEMSEMSQQPPRLITDLSPPAPARMSSVTQRSLAGLTKLDIPSPGGFFSDLSSASRDTWQMAGSTPTSDIAPPPPATSATAEQFYKTATWSRTDGSIPPPPPRPFRIDNTNTPVVERVVELPWEKRMDDLPTAVRIQATPITALRVPPTPQRVEEQTIACVDVTEIVPVDDAGYVHKQEENAVSHRTRTETWLMAQRAYLKGVINITKDAEVQSDDETSSVQVEQKQPEVIVKDETKESEDTAVPKKKTVRFSEAVLTTKVPKALPSKLNRQESAYWRAFADMTVRSQGQDVFVHRLPRFEALQAQRMCLREAHRNQLFGKYQLSVVPQSAKKRMSANVVRGDDQLVDDPEKIRADKEHDALSQMAMSNWHVAATKLLNGGRLIACPVAKRLARQSRMLPGPDGVSRDRARILDLGGMGTGDWAWHAALQYPNTKIYTVTTKAIRQLSNCNIRGPPNHRQVAVDRLTRLPFGDDRFDLISARELHSILKMFGENGEDEWEACLTECLRVLKPGGYIEFSVLDSDVMNAGPLGLAKSVEFGFTLKTLGYDPSPSKMFVNRLYRAGFEDVRRAWTCLPVGPKPRSAKASPPAPTDPETGLPVKTVQLEAMVTGEADNVAAVTGFVAGWSWERWILRTEMEKIAGELRLADTVTSGDKIREAGAAIDGIHAIVEEGRARGAGFRMLRGYARKPRPMGRR